VRGRRAVNPAGAPGAGRRSCPLLQELAETLERVTSGLEDVGADAAEAAPADGALAYS